MTLSDFLRRLAWGRISVLLRDSCGATSVEYAVMLALVLVVMIGAISQVGSETNGLWSGIIGNLQEVGFIP